MAALEEMNHLNFPMGTPIPLEVVSKFVDKIDWTDIYARYGTQELVFFDYYWGQSEPPEHLKGTCTHVLFYWEK